MDLGQDQVQEILDPEGRWVVTPVEAAVAPAHSAQEGLEVAARAVPDPGSEDGGNRSRLPVVPTELHSFFIPGFYPLEQLQNTISSIVSFTFTCSDEIRLPLKDSVSSHGIEMLEYV